MGKLRTLRRIFANKAFFWVSIGVITLFYLLLMSDGFFFMAPTAGYDDGLQFRLAQSLSNGEWLGYYDNLTLAKGITYPLWMATLHVLDTPLWFANALLYIAASLAIVFALRQAVRSRIALILVYVLTLFNPFITTRAYRDALAPALILLLTAWIIGFFLTVAAGKKAPHYIRNLVIFTIIGTVSLSMWWFLREDSFWILPFVIGGLAVTYGYLMAIVVKTKTRAKELIVVGALALVPFIILGGAHLGIAAVNNHYYGRFVVNDYTSDEFEDAYGALTRIKDDNWQMTVPVSENMREKAYEASPLFMELKPCLDAEEGQGACEFFRYNNIGITNSDYEGGWFFWALRLAAQQRGYYETPEKAADFYRRLASELNTACSTQRLQCEFDERSGLMAPFREEILPKLVDNIEKSTIFLITTDDVEKVEPEQLDNYHFQREAMANYLKVRYHPGELNSVAKIKRATQDYIAIAYTALNAALFIIALATLITLSIRINKFKQYWTIILVGWAIVLTILLRAVMLAYVETTSFPAIITLYYSSAYPLMFLFEGLFVGLLVSFIIQFIRNQKSLKKTKKKSA